MKKFVPLIIFVFSFIFVKRVDALYYSMVPDISYAYYGNTLEYYSYPVSKVVDNIEFYGFNASVDKAISQISYNFTRPSFIGGGSNDYTFYVYTPNVSTVTGNTSAQYTGSGTSPTVTFDGIACTTSPVSSSSTHGIISNVYFLVRCDNVVVQNNFKIMLQMADSPVDPSVDNFYGISSSFGISDHFGDNGSAAIVSSINQVEKQQQNTNSKLDQANSNLNNINSSIKDTNDTIKDSNVDASTSLASDFFSGFSTNTYGLTSVITIPLQLIGSITSSSCSPIGLPMPFVNQTVYLPCMSTIYNQYFGDFFKLYQTITFGIVAYWVCVKIMFIVKGFKDPDSDRIEVLDL